jgi:nitroreductase
MEVIEAIKTRRSVRRFQSTPVKESDLETVLEAARWAPSWANTQCWKFIVARDEETKAKLAETLSANNPATEAVRKAPVVIAACAEMKKSGFYKGEPVTDKGDYWYMFDVALAMENLVLTAHSLGLGTVHAGFLNAQKAAQVLGLPEGIVCVELCPLGYPEREPKAPPRKELSEIVSAEKYGQRYP